MYFLSRFVFYELKVQNSSDIKKQKICKIVVLGNCGTWKHAGVESAHILVGLLCGFLRVYLNKAVMPHIMYF